MAYVTPKPDITAQEDVYRRQMDYYLMHPYISDSGGPSGVSTPAFVGQLYFDTSGEDFYMATGTANTDWKQITT